MCSIVSIILHGTDLCRVWKQRSRVVVGCRLNTPSLLEWVFQGRVGRVYESVLKEEIGVAEGVVGITEVGYGRSYLHEIQQDIHD